MAAVGPVQGTSMGSMAPLKTSSSVSGATTWFLSHTASLTHNLHNPTSGEINLMTTLYGGTHVRLSLSIPLNLTLK